MKRVLQAQAPGIWLAFAAALALSGCAVIEGIFKAGVWVGVIAVVIVLGGAFGLARMLRS